MNRRSFLKLVGIGILGVFIPNYQEGNKMILGDTLEKMARNQPISENEINELRLIGNKLNDLIPFIVGMQDGSSNIKVSDISAKTGLFQNVPLGLAHFYTEANQSTTNSDWTALTLSSTAFSGIPGYFRWTSGSKIYIKGDTNNRAVIIYGSVQFDTNATGRRGIAVHQYDSADLELTSNTIALMSASSSNATIIPFAYPVILNKSASYLVIKSYQNSGSALDVSALSIALAVTS